jgi:hypothetical protein
MSGSQAFVNKLNPWQSLQSVVFSALMARAKETNADIALLIDCGFPQPEVGRKLSETRQQKVG